MVKRKIEVKKENLNTTQALSIYLNDYRDFWYYMYPDEKV